MEANLLGKNKNGVGAESNNLSNQHSKDQNSSH